MPGAFFSYASEDWTAEEPILSAALDQLERQVPAAAGCDALPPADPFDIFRDAESLRAGDHWHDRLMAEISARPVFIALLTDNWFTSTHCREEAERFLDTRTERNGVFIALRWPPFDARRIAGPVRPLWTRIKTFHQADWTGVFDIAPAARENQVRRLARHIGESLQRIAADPPPVPPARASGFGADPMDVPIAEGEFGYSVQGDWASARVVVEDCVALETEFGELVFAIRSIRMNARIEGGARGADSERFVGAGHDTRIARITARVAGPGCHYALQAESHDGPLLGHPFTDDGGGHFDLFQVLPEDGAIPRITGWLEFTWRAIEIDEENSDIEEVAEGKLSPEDRNGRRMKRALARIIAEETETRLVMRGPDEI